jgi:addiction module HigA family antidote
MSRLSTIIEEADVGEPDEWLANPHAGEVLALDFMAPLPLSPNELARAIDVPEKRLIETIEGERRMDADLDLRLARYFRMSPGFFLDLQTSYELLEARRALGGRLDDIIPRPAEAA